MMTATTEIDQLQALVEDTNLGSLERELHQPNIFYILGVQGLEIRHSNFLAWLLDPRGNHGLGDQFLRRFLKGIPPNSSDDWIAELHIDRLDLSEAEIRREWQNIDLLIIARGFTVAIENKVWSGEHNDQLARYRARVKAAFPNQKHAYVFLTPYGRDPLSVEDDVWGSLSYKHVADTLVSLLNEPNVRTRARAYITEYLEVLQGEIMQKTEAVKLAREIYKKHRVAMDFILNHRPDRRGEVQCVIEKAIENEGWSLGSSEKGFARFLTPDMKELVPDSGDKSLGWSMQEAFLFELDYRSESLFFRTVISPGNETHRVELSRALMLVQGATRPRGRNWVVHFNSPFAFNVADPIYDDEEVRRKLFAEVFPTVRDLVKKIEPEVVKACSQFMDLETT